MKILVKKTVETSVDNEKLTVLDIKRDDEEKATYIVWVKE